MLRVTPPFRPGRLALGGLVALLVGCATGPSWDEDSHPEVDPDLPLVPASFDSALREREWLLDEFREAGRLEGYGWDPDAISFSADGELIALADGTSSDGYAAIWIHHVASGAVVRRLGQHEQFGDRTSDVRLVFAPQGYLLASSGEDLTLRLWDVDEGVTVSAWTLDAEVGVLAWSPDGRHLAAALEEGVEEGHVVVFDREAHSRPPRPITVEAVYESVESLAYSSDGELLACGTEKGKVFVVRAGSGETVQRFGGHSKEVIHASFLAGSTRLLTVSRDGTARVWDVVTGQEAGRPIRTEGMGYIESASVSPDGRYVAITGVETPRLRVWSVADPERVLFEQARGGLCQFSPSGRLLACLDGFVEQKLFWLPGQPSTLAAGGPPSTLAAGGPPSTLSAPSSPATTSPATTSPETSSGGGSSPGAGSADPRTPAREADTASDRSVYDSLQLSTPATYPPLVFVSDPMDGLTTSGQRVRLRAGVQSVGDVSIEAVDVLLNGKRLDPEGDAKDLVVRPRTGAAPAGAAVQEVRIQRFLPLSLGANRIEVVARGSTGARSRKALTVTREVPRGRIAAVVVGIDAYRSVRPLSFARRDAEAVRDFLRRDLDVDADRVRVLVDDEATLPEVKDALGQWLPSVTGPEDTAFIYFSGHGATEEDPASEDGDALSKYLLPVEAHPERLFSTAFSMEDVRKIFRRVRARRLIFIADTCYSGAAGGRSIGAPGAGLRSVKISDGFLDRIARGEGRVVVAASGPNELSREDPGLGHGVFTHFLLLALRGAADRDEDGYVSLPEAFQFLSQEVPRFTKGKQRPVLKGELSGDLILGRARPR